MTAIIKNNFRLQNARDFLENLQGHPRQTPLGEDLQITSSSTQGSATFSWSWGRQAHLTAQEDAVRALKENIGAHVSDRNHYLFVGKPLPWGTGSPQEELYPIIPADTQEEEARIWDEMLALKKISNISGSLVIPRSDWDASGLTVYAIYDDKDPNLYRQPTPQRIAAQQNFNRRAGNFYALTDNYELFICLENGNGAPSQRKPQRTEPATALVDYSDIDGYVWKYITTLRQSDVMKYLTDSWMPIRTLGNIANDGSFQYEVEQGAVPGQVLSFFVDPASPGSGITNTFKGTISLVGTYNDAGVTRGTAQLTATTLGEPNAENQFYQNCELHIVDGPAAGEIYTILSYVSDPALSNRQVIVDRAWSPSISGAATLPTIEILPKFTIQSNGTSPIKARLVVSNGVVQRVVIFDRGQNATWASASVNTTLSQGAVRVRPILSPVRGLGKDPEKDLGAFFVMLNAKLQYDENDFPSANDYRQIGIIRNVRERVSSNPDGKLAVSDTLIATKSLTVTNISAGAFGVFRPDEILTTTSLTGEVISAKIIDYTPSESVANQGTITFVQTPSTAYGTFLDAMVVTGTTSGCNATIITNGVTPEEVVKFKGEILYIENRRPVLRSPDQIEDIKAIIEF